MRVTLFRVQKEKVNNDQKYTKKTIFKNIKLSIDIFRRVKINQFIFFNMRKH